MDSPEPPDLSDLERRFQLAEAEHNRDVVGREWALFILRKGAEGVRPTALLENTPPDVIREVALTALHVFHALSLMDDELKDEATMEQHVQLLIENLASRIPPQSDAEAGE